MEIGKFSAFSCIDDYMSNLQVYILFKNFKNLTVLINFIYGKKGLPNKGKLTTVLIHNNVIVMAF